MYLPRTDDLYPSHVRDEMQVIMHSIAGLIYSSAEGLTPVYIGRDDNVLSSGPATTGGTIRGCLSDNEVI